MEVKLVGKRGVLFTFLELKKSKFNCITNVYAIIGNKYFFVCDTYLGPFYMRKVKKYLAENFGRKKYVIFNSHGHWDHIWGNSEFKDELIISHIECHKYIVYHGENELLQHQGEFAKESIDIKLPVLTFDSKLRFDDECIEFFYSPGHTVDSSSCYDLIDRTLFVGDNMEEPISYVQWRNIKEYKNTISRYYNYDFERIITGHSIFVDKGILRETLNYLDKLMLNKKVFFKDKYAQSIHKSNIDYLRK